MIYRPGTKADYPYIKEFIDARFAEINPETLGGHWLLAVHKGKIYATIWCFVELPHAYIDYWAGSPTAATRLALLAEASLKRNGIRYIRGVVRRDRESAHRLVTEGIGMASAPNYHLIYKELVDGRRSDNNVEDDNTGSVRAGEAAT